MWRAVNFVEGGARSFLKDPAEWYRAVGGFDRGLRVIAFIVFAWGWAIHAADELSV